MSLILATATYESLINERKGPLKFREYVSERGYQLNEAYVDVFYHKIAHLEETDFVEIDRSILETFGYSNLFKIKKKNGVPELDENGNVRLIDHRNDFTNAVQALRKIKAFKEGKSLDDVTADYVLVPNLTVGGHDLLYVKKQMLEHVCIRSKSSNSHMIRESFLELYGAINEYMKYQRDFQIKKQMVHHRKLLKFNRKIDDANVKIQRVLEQTDDLLKQMQMRGKRLDILTEMLLKKSNNKVNVQLKRTRNEMYFR